MGNLFQELKRRKVFKVGAVYAVVTFVLAQVADLVLPTFDAPAWVLQSIVFLFVLGFPLAILLAWAYEVTPEGIKPDFGTQAKAQVPAQQNQLLIYATFALVLLVAGFQLSDRFFSNYANSANRSAVSAATSTNPAVMQASIILDQSLQRVPAFGIRAFFSLAPDGSALAYSDFEDQTVLLRDLATKETQQILTGPGFASFSPNSQKLLVFSDLEGKYSVMPAQGGGLQTLAIEIQGVPFWLSDEDIAYSHADGGMRIYSLADGTDEAIPGFDIDGEDTPVAGLFNRDAFFVTKNQLLGGLNQWEIQIYDWNNRSKMLVTNNGYFPQYVNSGHVLFIRAGDLWAVPFDLDALRVTGTEARILEGVDSAPILGQAAYSVSDSGRLVYLPGTEFFPNQTVLSWSDRSGNREEISLPAGHYTEPRLSPDEELLALTVFQADGSSDIWIYDFSRATLDPRTFSGNARSPVWTPDGSRLVYHLTSLGVAAGSRGDLWVMNADGTGQAERILNAVAKADSFSAIDEKLIYMTGGRQVGTLTSLSTLTFSDDAWISAPLLNGNFSTWGARVSPDGRWIAYGNLESGIIQIYVRPYPDLDSGKWQISSGEIANREPSWGPNSDELFFLRLDGTLMHTEITVEGGSFSPGIVEPLITDLQVDGFSTPNYSVSNDGERFLFFPATVGEPDTGLDQDHTELVVIENLFEEIRRLAPPDPQ